MTLHLLKKSSFLLFFIILCSFTHKFYVGTFQFDYVKNKKVFRLTVRIFIDDIEKVLKDKYGKNIYLTDAAEISEANQYLADYIKEKIKIKVNKQDLKLNFLAKEPEDNVLVCYFNAQFNKTPKEIEIYNNIFYETFSEQQNLLHLNILEKKETLLFNQIKNYHKLTL